MIPRQARRLRSGGDDAGRSSGVDDQDLAWASVASGVGVVPSNEIEALTSRRIADVAAALAEDGVPGVEGGP